MSKSSFNIVIVTLVASVVFANGTAWGQGNPTDKEIEIHMVTKIANPNGGAPVPALLRVRTQQKCPHYVAPATLPNGGWKYTTENGTPNKPLSYVDTSELKFDLPVTIKIDQKSYTLSIPATAIDEFYDQYLYKGYHRDPNNGADLSMNCHGHSTGRNFWFWDVAFTQLTETDYDVYYLAKDLAKDAVYGVVDLPNSKDHSIKIKEVTTKVVGNQVEYKITTSEKHRESGIYEKTVTKTYALDAEVELDWTRLGKVYDFDDDRITEWEADAQQSKQFHKKKE
jgi:hypothetical protein